MKNKIKILCTLGPSSMNEANIERLSSLGIFLFRINMSHTKCEDLESMIQFIRNITDIPICVDTEGAQIRNGSLKNGSVLIPDNFKKIIVPHHTIEGDNSKFSLYPEKISANNG